MPAQGRGAFLPPPAKVAAAAKLPAAKPNPSLRGLTGSAGPAKPFKLPTAGPLGRMNREVTRQGRVGPQEPRSAEGVKYRNVGNRIPQRGGVAGGAGGGLSLATIVSNPGSIVAQGYKNLATATGLKPLEEVGKIPSEAVNIPTQAAVSAYQFGHALTRGPVGYRTELEHMGHELLKQSAVAHAFKGEFGKALHAAGEHPLNTALEVSGGLHALDRAAYTIKNASTIGPVDAGAAISREPRQLPKTAVPKGGVAEPQKPYYKGIGRPKVEKRLSARQMTEPHAARVLKRNFDQFEAEALSATRQSREQIGHDYHKMLNKVPGVEAVGHFASGLLADPKVLAKDGTPLYRHQLAEAIEHYSQAPKDELPAAARQREEVRAHLVALNNDKAFHANPDAAYKLSQQIAERKNALEPELKTHRVYAGETMRIAKLVKPFRYHFRNQDPFVDTTTVKGESPFRLNGKEVSVSDVARRLEAHGVHENQLSFASTKPFQTEGEAFVSGRKPAGAKEAPGHLTGHNFMRGNFDPAPEALMRAELKTQKVINEARFQNEFNRRYPLKNSDIANLINGNTEHLPPAQRAAILKYADELHASKDTYFNAGENQSAWTRAKAAQEHLASLGIKTEPVRVAHPYATQAFRQGMAEHLLDHADLQDKLEPHIPGEEDLRSRLEPEPEVAKQDMTSGPVALVHPSVAAKLREYERNLGQAHLLQLPANFWRKVNVAFSVRHPAGVSQELGIRALLNNIGFMSLARGTRFDHYLKEWAAAHPDPVVKTQMQRLEADTGGTYASFAGAQGKQIPLRQLENTAVERPAKWWVQHEAQKLSGAPLRGIRMVVKAMGKTTTAILHAERRLIERPPMKAGMGKHFAEEYQRMSGKRMRVIGSMQDVEKAFLQGRLDPKAIDHAANVFKEYWGDWKSSSPGFRKAQSVSPFLRWYVNSLRFIFHTMPKDHPIQTGLLATLESASREQRQAEGQEYGRQFELPKGKLPSYQQGSLPLGGKQRYGFEYYSPPGAVSGGLESAIGATLPWATGLYNTLQGVNPLTHAPLEETNPKTGRKEPITSQGKLAMLGVLAGLESFVPPVRYATSLERKPPSYVFRPFRTETQHLVGIKTPKPGRRGERERPSRERPERERPTRERASRER